MKTTKIRIFVRKALGALLLAAPVLAHFQASQTFWGEAEIPESLRAQK